MMRRHTYLLLVASFAIASWGCTKVFVQPALGDGVSGDTQGSDAGDIGLQDTQAPDTLPFDTGNPDALKDTASKDSLPGTDTQPVKDTGATSDTGPDTSPDASPKSPIAVRSAVVSVTEIVTLGVGVTATDASAAFFDAKKVPLHTLEMISGYCELYLISDLALTCGMSCGDEEVCDADGVCQTKPKPLSAGALQFAGLTSDVTLVPNPDYKYSVAAPLPSDDLFTPGSVVTLSATGGEVAPFNATLIAPSEVSLNGNGVLQLKDDADLTVSWQENLDGSMVEILLQAGSSTTPPTGVIYCWVPESAGGVVIPKEMIAKFPYQAGQLGLPWPSFIRRMNRKFVETNTGTLDFIMRSQTNLVFTHTAVEVP